MRKNVGRVDAIIRITGGLLGLAYGVGRMGRRPYRTPWLLMGYSALNVAEGITRVCLMYSVMGINTNSSKDRKYMMKKIKEMGTKAVEMTQVTIGRSEDAKSKAQQASSQKQEHEATRSNRPENTENHGLTSEDKRIEDAVRKYVSTDENETKNRSESYSRDEHSYPTYS